MRSDKLSGRLALLQAFRALRQRYQDHFLKRLRHLSGESSQQYQKENRSIAAALARLAEMFG